MLNQIHYPVERIPLLTESVSTEKPLVKNRTEDRVNDLWLTFAILIQIAALITLDKEAKPLVSFKRIASGEIYLGRKIHTNTSIDWSSLHTKEKVTFLVFKLVFDVIPFFARFALSRSNYYLENHQRTFFVQNSQTAMILQLHMEEPDRGPLSIFNRIDNESLDDKFAKDIIRRRAEQNQLLAIQEKMKAFLSSDREMWGLFCKKYEKQKKKGWLYPRKSSEYDLPSPTNEAVADQWVRIGCQNNHIKSDLSRLVDFIASSEPLSKRFAFCYQRKLQTHPEEIDALESFCQSIFKTASSPIDIKKTDDSDEYLELILNPMALQTELGKLRVAWASLSSDVSDEMHSQLTPCFEEFVSSFDTWYRKMVESNFIKKNSKKLFPIRWFKVRDDIDLDVLNDWDKVIVQEGSTLLNRKLGKDKYLNWQNVLQKVVESIKIQVVLNFKEQFFYPLKQDVEQGQIDISHLLEKRKSWEKYLDVEGKGVFVRLEELLKTDLTPGEKVEYRPNF